MYANVIVDILHSSVDKMFDYIVPDGMKCCVGQRVKVSFGSKNADGIILSFSQTTQIPKEKLKSIKSVTDNFCVVNEHQIKLSYFIKEKYNTTLAMALRLMFPSLLRHDKGNIKTESYICLNKEKLEEAKASIVSKKGEIKYPGQFEIISALENDYEKKASDFNISSLNTLIKKGFVIKKQRQILRNAFKKEIEKINDFELTQDQKNALDIIFSGNKESFLIHGVTGSGKTEIYIRAIRETLKQRKTAIMLVPEISLTPQTYIFLKQRFDEKIAVFHSGLSDGERFDEWRSVKSGKAKIVLGARSAVFAPVENLGIIIIDEEHENSYKADNYPKYTAHEIAEERCRIAGAKLILGSATPSVNTYYDALCGKYDIIKLRNRMFGLSLPKVSIVDMREELKKGNKTAISGLLYEKISAALEKNKQIMLFLNRRGYSTFVMCRSCGHVVKCDACDVSMTYHKSENILKCHYCGRTKTVTNICPVCGKPHLKYFGMGTQQIEEQIQKIFPGIRVMRMDLDTMTKKDAHLKVFDDFSAHKADVLIGTQMITKGFDFKNVSLSAVLAADTMLNIPDYRSAEKTFMHITQVAGRAGREEAGEVVLQTYSPDNYAVIHASKHDYEGFYKEEIMLRKLGKLPPFTNIIQFSFSGENEEKVILAVKDFLKKIRVAIGRSNHDIISVRAAASDIKRINKMSRYDVFINIVKRQESKILKKLFSVFENEKYTGVLVGIDIE